MQTLMRMVPVPGGTAVSAQWAIPDGHRAASGDALILAHGAGNDMSHPFLSFVHRALAEAGILTVKFNFPFKEAGRRAPDRPAVLENAWQAVIDAVRSDSLHAPQRLFIGGKSLGGRIASLCAAKGTACDGLVFLGYPLHPAGRPSQVRTEHWPAVGCPALFVAGTRDPLCSLEVLRAERKKLAAARLHVIAGADHSFKLPASAPRSQAEVWGEIARVVSDWIQPDAHARP